MADDYTPEKLTPPDPESDGVGRRPVWIPRMLPLMAEPGEWFRIERFPGKTQAGARVHNMRTGVIRVPPGIWKVRARVTDDGSDLYAMFVMPSPDGSPKVVPGQRGRPRHDGLAPVSPTRVPYGA